ncbi:MAG: S-layer homology domain-containing protein [Anaerolineales bacterium]|nr:S-layer homology domain-containing protein [Anaerolineales bacterium]
MFKRFLNLMLLTALVAGMLAVKPSQPVSAQVQVISPETIINADGTLNAENNLTGPVNLDGWDVVMDPQHGPLFNRQNQPSAQIPFGNWQALGSGSGAVQSRVRTILVNGTDLYVGGLFVDFANIPQADYLVKWDGTNWSPLGSSSSGNGALTSGVEALAMIGSDLYAGGAFAVSSVPTGIYIAKWDGSNWSGLGSNGSGGSSLNSPVQALAVMGTTLYVGGYFSNVNNNGSVLTAADYVAAWDGTNWSALGSNGASDGSVTASPVNDLQVIGTDLFVGGAFTNVNNNGVSLPEADYIAKWDGTNWSALSSNGSGNGSISSTVQALTAIGTDLYVGGGFTNVNNGGTSLGAADYIAKWDGTNWSALGSNGSSNGSLSSSVFSLANDGVNLYVGGTFQNVNNGGTSLPTVDTIAKWDGSNWSGFGSNGAGNGFLPTSNTNVFAIGILAGDVWIAGQFLDPNNAGTVLDAADHLARWDGSSWNAAVEDSNGSIVSVFGASSLRVNAILVDGTDVYVGGDFTNVSNQGVNILAADYIVKWDGTNWSALGSNGVGEGSINSTVETLAMDGNGNLYVGGQFFNVNNNGVSLPEADYIAKWDGTNWHALGSNGSSNGALNNLVYSIATSGNDIYVGGGFTNVNNNGVSLPAADYAAKWDGTNWSALGSNGASDGSLNSNVYSLDADGSNVYVGGNFQNVNNNGVSLPEADYIAQWDGTNWHALGNNGAGNGSLNSLVDVLKVSGTNVYVGGNFQNVSNGLTTLTAADFIAKWDGTNWSALGNNGVSNNGSVNSRVFAIAVDGADVYIGGMFTNVNNGGVSLSAADYAAKWDGTNWSALGTPGQTSGSLNTLVYALAIYNDDLLVGGEFSNVLNQGTTIIKEADYIAAYGMTPNSAPTDIALSTSALAENLPSGTTVGTFSSTDPNLGDTFTYSFCGGADDASFSLTGNALKTAAIFDFETKTSYSICIRTTDNGALTFDKTFVITVNDVNENSAPTDIALSASALAENLPSGTTVGTFSSTDPNLGDTFTYTLVSGTGSDDNAAFSITGNTLKSAQPFNFLNKSSYSIRVRSTDNGGLSFEKVFSIAITDGSAIFADVPSGYWAESFIERLYNAGITGGCSTNPLNYCPTNPVTRAQMAIFLEKGIHGSSFSPVDVIPTFTDTIGHFAEDWIEALKNDGVTSGCGTGIYCPENAVTRDQMAVFLLKAKYGAGYTPPAVGANTGFSDVASDYWAAAWIKQLAAEAITGGCGSGNYCPENAVTRDQMAVFLVKTFGLP